MSEPSAPSPGGKLPGSVTALAVASLVLAALGLASAGFGVLGLLMQRQTFTAPVAASPGSPDVFGAMVEMQERLLLPTLAMNACFLLAALVLGATGILVLLRHASVPRLGPALLVLTACLWVLGSALEVWIQQLTMSAMSDVMSGLTGTDPAAADVGPVMSRMFGIGTAITLGCVGVWLLIKLSFVAWAALHLRSPDVARYFGGTWTPGIRGD
jgi:hypothetical protein